MIARIPNNTAPQSEIHALSAYTDLFICQPALSTSRLREAARASASPLQLAYLLTTAATEIDVLRNHINHLKHHTHSEDR